MVLTTNGGAHHHILTFDEGWEDEIDDRVTQMVDEMYNVNDCRYTYSTDKVLTFTDHWWKQQQ